MGNNHEDYRRLICITYCGLWILEDEYLRSWITYVKNAAAIVSRLLFEKNQRRSQKSPTVPINCNLVCPFEASSLIRTSYNVPLSELLMLLSQECFVYRGRGKYKELMNNISYLDSFIPRIISDRMYKTICEWDEHPGSKIRKHFRSTVEVRIFLRSRYTAAGSGISHT